MARTPKPTNLKILEGNPGKRPLPINEVSPLPIADACPEWLSESAKAVWNEFAPRLERLKLLTEADSLDFQNLCIHAGLLRDAYMKIREMPLTMQTESGYEMQRPEIGIINNSTRIIATLSAKFGMSPVDRVGLVDPRADEKKSKMSGLLSG